MKGKTIIRNLIGAVIFVVLLATVLYIILGLATRHNKELEVPDLAGLSVAAAAGIAHSASMRVEVIDSVYVRNLERGAVYSQNPKAGAKVKKNRRILLTINATIPKQVQMPNVINLSLRQAKAEIIGAGLKVGRLTYVSDMATNNVLKQIYNGRDVRSGKMLESESEIDLVLGLNEEDNQTYIPNLIGYTLNVAKSNLLDNSLNVGRCLYDSSVQSGQDSLNATIYKQVPEASASSLVIMGTYVDLYFTADPEKSR